MSNVITPEKSDDVLTLIRRLVVEAPLVLEDPVELQDDTAADPVPLLVLTPALRVAEGEGDSFDPASQNQPDRVPVIEPLLLVQPILPEPPQEDLSDAAASAMLADFRDEPVSASMSAAITGRAEDLGVDPQELRALVRDLIREELAGGLGTRMTRNIRRLVRVEIARELALREPE